MRANPRGIRASSCTASIRISTVPPPPLTFLLVLLSISSFTPRSSFAWWMMQITVLPCIYVASCVCESGRAVAYYSIYRPCPSFWPKFFECICVYTRVYTPWRNIYQWCAAENEAKRSRHRRRDAVEQFSQQVGVRSPRWQVSEQVNWVKRSLRKKDRQQGGMIEDGEYNSVMKKVREKNMEGEFVRPHRKVNVTLRVQGDSDLFCCPCRLELTDREVL